MTINNDPPWGRARSEDEERERIMRDIGVLVGRLVDLEINSDRHAKSEPKDKTKDDKIHIGDEVLIHIRGMYRGKRAVVHSKRGTYWNLRVCDDDNPNWKRTGKLIHKKPTSFSVLN